MVTSRVNEGPDDIAARVDPASLGRECPRELDRAEIALAHKETVRESSVVEVSPNNVALVVDSICLRVRSARIIDAAEHSVSIKQEAMGVKRVIVEAYDISGSIDRVWRRVGSPWKIYSGEVISTAPEAVASGGTQIIFADNVAAGIDSPTGCVHRPRNIKGQKCSPCE